MLQLRRKHWRKVRWLRLICAVLVTISLLWLLSTVPHSPPDEEAAFRARFGWLRSLHIPDLISTAPDSYLLRPNATGGASAAVAPPLLYVVVISAPQHAAARAAIRDTWASQQQQQPISVVFLCGLSWEPAVNAALRLESARHGDILQDTLVDHYQNLTLKSVSMLKWLSAGPPSVGQADYFLKVDDDMYVDMAALVARLRQWRRHQHGSHAPSVPFCAGYVYEAVRAYRQPDAKYFLPRQLHGADTLPPFVSGTAYLLSRAAVVPLYRSALTTPFVNLEDVFTTGLAARGAGLQLHALTDFQRGRPLWRHTCLTRGQLTVHGLAPAAIGALYATRHANCDTIGWRVLRRLMIWQV